jgi:hypothetical protein
VPPSSCELLLLEPYPLYRMDPLFGAVSLDSVTDVS